MENKIIPFKRGELEYFVAGEGSPVIFIHGFGEDYRIWEDVPSKLPEGLSFYFPNLPGTGKSTALEHPSMEGFAEAIVAMMTAEGISRAQIVGHSMGGYTAMAMAASFAEKMESLVMFHSSAMADTEEKKAARKKSITFIQENGAAAFLKSTIPGLFYDAGKSAQQIQTLLEQGRQFSPETLIGYYEAMIARKDRLEVLKSFPREVVFILGEHDKAVPLEAGLKQVHLPVRSSFHILQNTAHMGMLEEPLRAWHILRVFLSEASVKLNH